MENNINSNNNTQLTAPACQGVLIETWSGSQPCVPVQPYQMPVYQQPQYNDQLAAAYNRIACTEIENAQLHMKVQQKELAEQAYSEVFTFADERTYTRGKSGQPQELMNRAVREAIHVTPLPPSTRKPFYLIWLNEMAAPLVLDEDDYLNNKKLLAAIQEIPGVEVKFRRSLQRTTELLRKAISEKTSSGYFSPYAGWISQENKAYFYRIFPNKTTCLAPDNLYSVPNTIGEFSPAVAAAAANQFWPTFTAIRDPFIRWLDFMWFHAAALYSLLEMINYGLPLSLCVFSTDNECLTYLRQLFSWFGSSALPLNMTPSNFSASLLARKDQPLLIEDLGRLEYEKKNIKAVETVLVEKQVMWKSKENITLPIQGLPTILSSRASSISCAPEVMTVELSADEFDRDTWIEHSDRITDNWDYISAFVGYTEKHIPELRSALADGSKRAIKMSDGSLNEKCFKTLGIMLGLDRFLTDFIQSCAPVAVPPIEPFDDKIAEDLLELLTQTSEKEENAGLADQFIEVARSHIQTGFLPVCTKERYTPEQTNLVLFDDSCIHFTGDAFRAVCQDLHQSSPVVLHALTDANLLRGATVNETTFTTRISVYNVHGVREEEKVYSVDRSAFDKFGDPLQLEEVDI